jgi:hypothetical protein
MNKDEVEDGGYIAHVKETRNAQGLLVRKLEEKRLPGRTMCRWMKLSLKYLN